MKKLLSCCLEGSATFEDWRGIAHDLSKSASVAASRFGAGCSRGVRQHTAVLCLVLAACGGGGSSPEPAKPAPVVRTNLLVIGNSITRHGPLPGLGWAGDWGMAASEQGKDFAHLTGAALGLPVTAINTAVIETDPAAPLPTVSVGSGTVVVVELGDNGLPVKYAELLASVNRGAALACTSTYWHNVPADAVMKTACEAAGGRWVFIGDIFKGRLGRFANEGVDLHPGDAEMAEISRRLVAALG